MTHSTPTRRRSCTGCGEAFDAKSWQKLCWQCWRRQQERVAVDDAYDRGYSAGYCAGRNCNAHVATTPGQAAIDRDLIAQAIRLTHPDRHPPERGLEANSVTAALLSLRAA